MGFEEEGNIMMAQQEIVLNMLAVLLRENIILQHYMNEYIIDLYFPDYD